MPLRHPLSICVFMFCKAFLPSAFNIIFPFHLLVNHFNSNPAKFFSIFFLSAVGWLRFSPKSDGRWKTRPYSLAIPLPILPAAFAGITPQSTNWNSFQKPLDCIKEIQSDVNIRKNGCEGTFPFAAVVNDNTPCLQSLLKLNEDISNLFKRFTTCKFPV